MKLKHSVWFLIGVLILSIENNPYIFNGQDLLGWIVIIYTGYHWLLSPEFKQLFFNK